VGAIYVTVALVAVQTLGASGLDGRGDYGQLTISVMIDRFGRLRHRQQHVGLG